MLGFLPTRAYRPGTPGATTFLSPLSGTFNYGWDSFLRAVERYIELDPLSVLSRGYAAFHCLLSRDFDAALEHARLCEKLDPGIWGPVNVAICLEIAGHSDESFQHLLRVEDRWDVISRGNAAAYLAYALGRQGRHADFEELVRQLELRVKAGTATWTELALAYMGIGDHERVLSYLERAPDQRPPGGDMTAWLGVYPHFDPLRDDSRFRNVLRRLSLPQ